MEYISTKDAAQLWGISLRRVQDYCVGGIIKDAKKIGKLWFIPVGTEKPLDRRTVIGKKAEGGNSYRFPVFIYSEFYNHQEQLNAEEKQLLSAQVKYLEGNHIEGLFLSREIIQNTKQPYIKAGAYYTITFNSMLLGLSSSAFEALENVKKIALEDPIHAEDYNLMACYLQMHIYHEISTISNVNPQKLSSDAINMYDLMLQLSRLITNVQRTNTEIRQAMLVCRRYELLHIPALELELNGIMAGIFTKEPDMLDSYLSKMVNIAEKNKWYSILAKYAYFYNNKETISLLEKRSSSGLKKYLSLRDKNSKNWLILFKEARRGIPDSFSFEDTEIIILLSYNLTNEEISTLMNRPKEEISRHIHQLCKKLGLKTKKELIEHYTLRS